MAVCITAQTNDIPALQIGRPGTSAIYSTDHRFMVSGMSSAENMVLANSLSEWSQRVEQRIGFPLPMERFQTIGVMVQSLSSAEDRILKMQGWDGGRFYQRLVIPGALRLDGEDLQEAVCWLLLNRYAVDYTPTAQRFGMGAAVPDWIAVGLAQNTQTALRSRNREWISRELAEGRTMQLAEVIRQAELPPGRWREKAYATAAVDFLFPHSGDAVWPALFKAVALRIPIDAEWLKNNSPVLEGVQNPEGLWHEQLEKSSRVRTVEVRGDHSLMQEERLLKMLNIRPRDMADDIPPEIPSDLFARDLIEYRSQPWVPAVASALSLQVQSLKLGSLPAFQQVLSAYTAYFDQFQRSPVERTSRWRRRKNDPADLRPPDDTAWLLSLQQLWIRAETAHRLFLEQYQTRKSYVDSFDRMLAVPAADALMDPMEGVPRTRIQRYMDDIERRGGR